MTPSIPLKHSYYNSRLIVVRILKTCWLYKYLLYRLAFDNNTAIWSIIVQEMHNHCGSFGLNKLRFNLIKTGENGSASVLRTPDICMNMHKISYQKRQLQYTVE
uniref:Uncharacterized protein n=1 Tax=Glossina austeni TaxID=7395 RepID=A0A1A9USC5_GLOAU